MHVLGKTGSQAGNRFTVFGGAIDDLVVDIGDVADISHLISRRFQPAVNDVERHHHPGMPYVTIIVNRHAAYVHSHFTRFNRRKDFFASR